MDKLGIYKDFIDEEQIALPINMVAPLDRMSFTLSESPSPPSAQVPWWAGLLKRAYLMELGKVLCEYKQQAQDLVCLSWSPASAAYGAGDLHFLLPPFPCLYRGDDDIT